jgi:hypothetical protein
MGERCESLDPVGLLGRNIRCDLAVGHGAQHKATRSQDGWTSTVFWAQDPVDDELRALRKLAAAASAYLDHSTPIEAMYWSQQLTLHNAIAHWRNLQATPKTTKKPKRSTQRTSKESP